MTEAGSQAALAHASIHVLSAQLYLVPIPDTQKLVDTLGEVRSELQRREPRLLSLLRGEEDPTTL